MPKLETALEIVDHFNKNIKRAKNVLKKAPDKEFKKNFSLKNNGKILDTSSKEDSVRLTINHLVHHRGQLTVYMRLNKIPVPAIYGPSGDDNIWM